ncbi:Stf0 family sulfotransferase [Hasllibacter sp. MH4015]|uniref:Stf0 family sulfotransferase n=1 Tax=Hasllibacter sp. MH4015 TaxID=2854029 RepID=UPI001CD48914
MPVQSYIICTTPRSGSTLLCKLLAATEQAGQPDSHFHTPSLDRWLDVYGLNETTFRDDRERLVAIFRAAHARGTGEGRIFGLRMQRKSFPFFMAQARHLQEGHLSDLEVLEAAFGATKIIHLSRADKVEQAVSLVIAEQSGLWHRAADGSELERLTPAAEPIYDRDRIKWAMADLTRQDAEWEDWFSSQGVAPLRLTYSALAHDPNAVLAEVLAELGLDPALADGVRPPVAKLADARNAEWCARYKRSGDTP